MAKKVIGVLLVLILAGYLVWMQLSSGETNNEATTDDASRVPTIAEMASDLDAGIEVYGQIIEISNTTLATADDDLEAFSQGGAACDDIKARYVKSRDQYFEHLETFVPALEDALKVMKPLKEELNKKADEEISEEALSEYLKDTSKKIELIKQSMKTNFVKHEALENFYFELDEQYANCKIDAILDDA